MRPYDSHNNLLYSEIINILVLADDRNVVTQQSIFFIAQIINSLENKCTVWTLYEVFMQEMDSSIGKVKEKDFLKYYKGFRYYN